MSSEQRRPGAYFDVDGTVFKSSLVEKVVDGAVKEKIFDPNAFVDASKLRKEWQFNNNESTYLQYISALVGGYVTQIAGVKVAELDKVIDDVVAEHKVRRFLFPRKLMADLGESHHTIAISGSPQRIVSKFVADMPFVEVVGSYYEIKDGRYTGLATATPDKASVRERLIGERNLIARGDVAVGDTMGDAPILEVVEFPIMFNSSATLEEYGRRRDWPMILERKDAITVLEAIKATAGGYEMTSVQSLIGKIRQ